MYFSLINSTNYTIMKCISLHEMLVLAGPCDVALLGILGGCGHVAGRGELLLDAGDLALA